MVCPPPLACATQILLSHHLISPFNRPCIRLFRKRTQLSQKQPIDLMASKFDVLHLSIGAGRSSLTVVNTAT